ncbi:MAG: type IVB secretion system protein IcmH/DotU [Rhodospirillales bacterium]|nr:type IVB secretion system protein IcmH/DotU [Rhodospirillales bacterium]
MSDNPFSEPDDSDRTVIRPAPGGRPARPASEPTGLPPAPEEKAAPASGPERIAVGSSALLAAAAPLLQLLSRLRNTLSQPDPAELLARTVREVQGFEQAARGQGVPIELLRPAHYALCASIDDVVLNTPWGSQGAWARRSLVSTFHQEVQSGERFFELLAQIRQNPGRFLPVLELMYLCLSLGFMGRYRLSARGPGELERLREETYAVLARSRAAAPVELSPHWRGVTLPYRPQRTVVPVWVAGVAGLAVIAGLWFWTARALNAASDGVFAKALAVPPPAMPAILRAAPVKPPPPPPPPAVPGILETLRGFLAPEIKAGLVEVLGTEQAPIVRIENEGMFASGSAVVSSRFVPLLERIGSELKVNPGRVEVRGYTDSEPIHTVEFPSNYQLSKARAAAAAAILARTIGNPARMTVEGLADADPIAPNTTAAGRAKNRRIEIVLIRQG